MFYFVNADCPDFVGNGARGLDPINCTLYYIFGGLPLLTSLFLFPNVCQIKIFIVLRLRSHFWLLNIMLLD